MAVPNKEPDPGWNDPPTFTYDKATQIQTTAGKKGVTLNKRIAFPLSGMPSSQSGGGIDPTMPPQPINKAKIGTPPVGPPLKSAEIATSSSTQEETFDNSSSSILDDRLKEVLENLRSCNCLHDDEEISKRLKIMEKMWTEGKLDGTIQLRLLHLSEALRKGDITTADHIQKSLMVDYVGVCSSWMGSIRQLINLRREDG